MTYKSFYFGKLDAHLLENIDSEHKAKMELLIEEINLGAWTKRQYYFQHSLVQMLHRSRSSKRRGKGIGEGIFVSYRGKDP